MKGKWKHCPGRRTPAREGVGFRTSRRGEEGPISPGIKVEPLCISPHCSMRVCPGNVLIHVYKASGRIRSDLYTAVQYMYTQGSVLQMHTMKYAGYMYM